jgi:hypothetical protein
MFHRGLSHFSFLFSLFNIMFAFILPFYFLRVLAYSFPWSQRYDLRPLIDLDIVMR